MKTYDRILETFDKLGTQRIKKLAGWKKKILVEKEYECQSLGHENARKNASAKVSGIYDIENNIMIDAKIDKYTTPERPLAKENIENMLEILGDDRKIVTFFNRGYISIGMLIFLMVTLLFYLFRVHGGTYAEEKALMKSDDEIVCIQVNGE